MRPVVEQTVLINGATDGLGKVVATELARAGAIVLVHGRDDDRGKATLKDITGITGNARLRWYRADIADLDQVRQLAAAVAADTPRLDALISNAGIGTVYPSAERQENADGIELRFAVNYLAGFLLIRLLPTLRASAPARIVHVSSAGQSPIDFNDVMPTKIVATPVSTLKSGVDATLRLVLDRALDGVSGRYYNGQRQARAHPQAYDPVARARLRALSEQLTGLNAPQN